MLTTYLEFLCVFCLLLNLCIYFFIDRESFGAAMLSDSVVFVIGGRTSAVSGPIGLVEYSQPCL